MRRLEAALAVLVFGGALLGRLWVGVPSLEGEAILGFSEVRSLYFDHDLDLRNELAHFGAGAEPGARPSVEAAVLWMPFYAVGDLWARLIGQVEGGYSKSHITAVCLGSLAYGGLGLWLLFKTLASLVGRETAFFTTPALLYGTFLLWYMANEGTFPVALSFFASSLVLFLYNRGPLSPRSGAFLGLGVGIASGLQFENIALLLLPLASLLALKSEPKRALVISAATLSGFLLGALPQILAGIFGHASGGFGRTPLIQALFSSRHGILFWTPLLWGGFLGYVVLLRRNPRPAVTLLLALLLLTYGNVRASSFSNPGFAAALPLLGVGLGFSLLALFEIQRAHPSFLLAALGGGLVLWNLLFMEVYRRMEIPQDDTVAFSTIVQKVALFVTSSVGSPPAWPANWVFAKEHDLPVEQYDLMVGRYLFDREGSGDAIVIGDLRSDPALLDQGWSSPHPCEGETCRGVLTDARIFAPLRKSEDFNVVVRAKGSGVLKLKVNGAPHGELPLTSALSDFRVEATLQGGLNEFAFEIPPKGEALLSRVTLLRKAGR